MKTKPLIASALAAIAAATLVNSAAQARGPQVGFVYGSFASRYNEERRIEEERRRAFLEAVAARKTQRETAGRATTQKSAGQKSAGEKSAAQKAATQAAAQKSIAGSAVDAQQTPKSRNAQAKAEPAQSERVRADQAASAQVKTAQAGGRDAASVAVTKENPVSQTTAPVRPGPAATPEAIPARPATQPARLCQRFLPSVGLMVDGPCDQ